MLQALSNNYACLQAHVNNALTWQSSCVIANNARKTANAICSRLLSRSSRCNKVHAKNINVTGTYVIIVLVYRRLLTTSLGRKAAV